MITLADYYMGRDEKYPSELTGEIRANASKTVARANLLVSIYREQTGDTEQRHVNSGWRPAEVNAGTPNAAKRSKHMTGEAIDISDPDGDLDEWCLENEDVLVRLGLFLEHPSATKNWCHVQIVAPRSGKRIFYP